MSDEPSDIEILLTGLNLLDGTMQMQGQPLEDRTVARDERVKDPYGVSTVLSPDMGFETAIINSDTETGTMPVERYETREAAEAGHARWVERLPSLTKVTKLGYGGLVEDQEVEL